MSYELGNKKLPFTIGFEVEFDNSERTVGNHVASVIEDVRVGWGSNERYDRWRVKYDQSTGSNGNYGCEVVSPILKKYSDLEKARDILKLLKSKRMKGKEDRCGFHIHIGIPSGHENENKFLKFLVRYESILYMLCHPSRGNSTYAKKFPNNLLALLNNKSAGVIGEIWGCHMNKYYGYNGVPFVHNSRSKKTFEFRMMETTNSFDNVYHWIMLVLQIAEETFKNGKDVQVGRIKAKDSRTAIQTFMEQAGLYSKKGPPWKREIRVSLRKWILKTYRRQLKIRKTMGVDLQREPYLKQVVEANARSSRRRRTRDLPEPYPSFWVTS